MWQVIYATNFCCYCGVFQRDIKLENLLMNPCLLEIKLIDFGCGELMSDSAYKSFSCTRPYMPPEYYDRGFYHAKSATVGVLLFVMLHGRFPQAINLSNDRSVFAVSQECIHFFCRLVCRVIQSTGFFWSRWLIVTG
ncbi:hypothetical protein G5714_010253 [Onychostoma macrolepis]|uniref:non-specific serine/threonine protein kinase n=1 Tax=Onychostoma macrolepis TaxID=369639 RepID=A0A7J6CPM3_9TELE|nr:hypothetical protein G5714_010253 [Onychostoma macrolepis]